MILKITVPERGENTKLELAQTIFAKVIAVQILEDEIKYFLEGKNLLETCYWASTSNFCVVNRLKKGHLLLAFQTLRYDEQWCEEKSAQGIRVVVEEVESFPLFQTYPISRQKEFLDP